ncbi:hypothetical protein HPULCUR_002193 [Helicostylum pulchrum]|uniref:Uncharacterized protein n=1 Tax=Helicostylum pulchrum TaxID=562976 RepID=A0ABP9XPV3_9FUNG
MFEELKVESNCCIVCLDCFFCKKSREKNTNVFCRCSDTLLLSHVPASRAGEPDVMKKNVYKRAFIINWVQKNAHAYYNLNGGWHIDAGRLLVVPLCIVHHTDFQTEWSQRSEDLRDKGIRADSTVEVKDVTKFFVNWSGAPTYSNDSIDLKKVRPLPCYPFELYIPVETDETPTFNDILGYHTLTAVGRERNNKIVFYDVKNNKYKQLGDDFPVPVDSLNKKPYMVGMLPQNVNANEMICNFNNDSDNRDSLK